MLIELQNIYKIYNAGKGDKEVRALDGVSLSIEKGSYNAIVGHSGSGKSTLMNILGCLDTPDGGEYLLGRPSCFSNDRQWTGTAAATAISALSFRALT